MPMPLGSGERPPPKPVPARCQHRHGRATGGRGRKFAGLAEAIVAGRPYATVVDLNAKLRETLSEDAAAAVLANVFVPVNLNTASEAESSSIPGMSDRMVHEFLEYRPYEDMASSTANRQVCRQRRSRGSAATSLSDGTAARS